MIIVVDFDGTLALGDTSDISYMSPNMSIISIVNDMYNDGNVINIVTARGSKSCKTIKERELKYYEVIEKWLKRYNVKYHKISFNKEYADIYIDDRAYNIKETFHYQKLDSNFTSNKVRRLNDRVVKKTENSVEEFTWYSKASEIGIKIPNILSYDTDTISTNFINGKVCKNFDLISNTIKIFKDNYPKQSLNFSNYINRISNHLDNNTDIINGGILIERLSGLIIPNTFNHGDFSVYNMIESDNELYLIDPIFSYDLFQSYLLDVSKHLFSILYYLFDYELYEHFRESYSNKFNIEQNYLDILMASESVRVTNRNKKFLNITNNLIDSIK